MTNEEIDEFMLTVRPPHRYCWPLIKSNAALYTYAITEEEWKDWLARNPRINTMTSKDGWEIPQTSKGHIPLKREPRPRNT